MLIFDNFPSEQAAQAFALAVRDRFQLTTQVFVDADKASAAASYPFILTSPLVLVARSMAPNINDRFSIGEQVRDLVADYLGEFAGT